MDALEANRLPNILQTFQTYKGQPPDNKTYIERINHYLSIFYSKSPATVSTALYETLIESFGKIWEELYIDKESEGELKNVHLTWWEANGSHRLVDAEYYLKNWETNYAELAENWNQIEGSQENINRITHRIKMGIAGILYVGEYEDALFATLKYHQQTYRRLDKNKWSPWGKPSTESDREMVKDITKFISAFLYSDRVAFLGELSGAYILSCPLKYIKSDSLFQKISRQKTSYSTDEICTSVLLTYICAYGSQEFAMNASSLPMKRIKKPEEEWKYFVEIPKTP